MGQLVPVEGDPFAATGAAKFVPVDHDPFSSEGAPSTSLVAVDHDPFAEPKKPGGLPGAEVRAYEPTWREKIAQWMLGDEPASPEREALVSGVMGTRGLPGTEQMGVVDFTPARIPLFVQEAVRSAEKGDALGTALNALGATPVPVLIKAVGAVADAAKARLAPKLKTAEAAQRLGVDLPRSVDSKTAGVVKEVPVPDIVGGNPIPAGATRALEQTRAAADDLGRESVPAFQSQAALRDWLLAADDVSDDAAKAAQEAATGPAIPQASTAAKIPEAALASNVGPDAANMNQPVPVMRTAVLKPEEAARTELVARDAKALGSSGQRAAGEAGNGLAQWLPPTKTPQEIVLDAKKARLGAALGMDGPIVPSKALARIDELVHSGSADDVVKVLKVKSMIGDAWDDVAGGILNKMGLGNDLTRFTEEWAALSKNGKGALLGDSALRQSLDDLVVVLKKLEPLQSKSKSVIGNVRADLEGVPIIGPMLGRKFNTAAHVAVGAMTGGHSTAVSAAALVAGKFLNRPQNVKSLTRWLKAYEALSDNSKGAATVFSLASRNLAKSISDESGDDEAEIARKLESVRQ